MSALFWGTPAGAADPSPPGLIRGRYGCVIETTADLQVLPSSSVAVIW